MPSRIKVVSDIEYNTLPSPATMQQQQKVVEEQALIAGKYASEIVFNSQAELELKMKEQGVTINEIDTAPFIEATKATYDILGYSELRKELYKSIKKQGANDE